MTTHGAWDEPGTVGSTADGIAYQAARGGYPDLLLIPDGLLPMAALAQFAPYADFLDHLGSLGRLVMFDRRGIGASAAAGRGRAVAVADWADDADGVLAATGSVRTIVVALAEGAMTAVALAARHPARVSALVLVNATPGPSLAPLARRGRGPGYIDYLRSTLPGGWQPDLPGIEVIAPSLGRDPTFSAWLTDAFRQAGDARRFLPAFDLALRSDVRAYLALVQTPTLVVHRRDDAWFFPQHGRLLAAAIRGARYVELPGADHAPYVSTAADLLGAIGWFITDTFPTTVASHRTIADNPDQPLTPRQAQVVQLVGAGLTDHEIAERLGLSHRTIHKHLELAYRRLGVRNRTAAAVRFNQPTHPSRRPTSRGSGRVRTEAPSDPSPPQTP